MLEKELQRGMSVYSIEEVEEKSGQYKNVTLSYPSSNTLQDNIILEYFKCGNLNLLEPLNKLVILKQDEINENNNYSFKIISKPMKFFQKVYDQDSKAYYYSFHGNFNNKPYSACSLHFPDNDLEKLILGETYIIGLE